MYERLTDHRESKKVKEIYSPTKASNSEGMGIEWQWDRGCQEVSDSSSYAVSVEEGTGARGRGLSK